MILVPNAVSRFVGRSVLKLSANSPTILVVGGVIGLGTTAIVAARATRSIDPILEGHQKGRLAIEESASTSSIVERTEQKAIAYLYLRTGKELGILYAPAILLGTVSAACVLSGHNILKGRYVATALAYGSLQDQFISYRGRIAKTFGEEAEKAIYTGGSLEYKEDPNHKGEYKLEPSHSEDRDPSTYLRPWFDETNPNCKLDPVANYLFLKGAQAHLQNTLEVRGHVFLNDVYDALGMRRRPEGAVAGWLWNGGKDNLVDFGFMTNQDPNSRAFRNHDTNEVQLDFNIDGEIWQNI